MVIDGRKIASEILERMEKAGSPKKFLAAFLIGDDPASESFIKQKEKTAKELGIDFRIYRHAMSIDQDDLRSEILKIVGHKTCGGAIVQLPLPPHVNRQYVLNAIPREKDVDVLGERALGAFYAGRNPVLPPAVGVVEEILERFQQSEHHSNTANATRTDEKIVEKELSYRLGGMFFKIHDELGRFATEKQYADFFEKSLKQSGLAYKREQPISVSERLSNFVDFLIEDKILIDFKAKPFVTKEDYFQMKRYLESVNLPLGLVVNFRSRYLKPKRVLNSKIQELEKDVRIDSEHSNEFASLYRLKVAVVGLGFLVGKPISEWLKGRCVELYLLDIGSDLSALKNADLVILGTGQAGLIKPEMLKDDALVIDFGYGMLNGKISGDFDASSFKIQNSKFKISYTPTPGGTGPILVAKLFENFYSLNS